ncbi:MAG: DUF4159 domain-containing protein [Verrucomicrobia bacterium]|nr:DUF4159 domain-containing protein [Verrucomicrobiota bacterium]
MKTGIKSFKVTRLLWVAVVCFLSVVLAGADGIQLQCGNLVYAGNKSSVCFADKFLSDIVKDTNLNVRKNFTPVKLDSDALFDVPFCVFSGEDSFTLTDKERQNLRKFLLNGGFILASPGCSDDKWDKAFRKEIKLCFPDNELMKIPMNHPMFSTVHPISRLTCKNGNTALLEGLEINGRIALVYSKEGLNDIANAKGCCCCGGNQINDSAKVNVNIFTYSLLY